MQLKNPADISSTSLIPRNYGIAAYDLLASDEFDLLLGFFSLSSHLILPDKELVDAVQRAGKPAVACFLGSQKQFAACERMPERYGIPCYCDPNDAAAAVTALVSWGKAFQQPVATEIPALTMDQKAAVKDYLQTLNAGTLTEYHSRKLLQLAGIPVDLPVITASAQEAAESAKKTGYPLVLKLHSGRITHKSDVGGVRTGLNNENALLEAYEEMLPRMQELDPQAQLSLQPMYPDGFELIIGAVRQPGTGPLVMAGMGGIYAEVLQDTAFRLAPVSADEAQQMLDSLRCGPILRGFRGQTLHYTGVARLITQLSALLEVFPRIQEVDINPCRVYGSSIAVLDARVVLDKM